MFLIAVIMGVFLVSVSLIIAGLYLMQQEQTTRRPASLPPSPGSKLAPASSDPALSELSWQRPFLPPIPLTTGNAVLYMIIGLFGIGNFIFSLAISIWLELPLGTCSFLYLIGGGWLFFLGLRNWQRIRALESRGQLTQGVIFDRWLRGSRGLSECVAYYFDLPWGSRDGSRIIRAEINGKVYRAFQIGDSISIRYLPDQPQVCRVER
jgi:hypothetical protein